MDEQEVFVDNQPIPEELLNKKKGKWWKILLAVLGGLILLIGIAGFLLWQINDFIVYAVVHGEKEITVEYSDPFEDPGAEGYFVGTHVLTTPVAMPVEVRGEVDTAVVGDYEILYEVNYEIDLWVIRFPYHALQKRTVHVVDTQAPVITLTVNEESYTLPGQTYVEEGFTAVDGYDGDITQLVQRQETAEKIVYTVMDAAGNTATVERIIKYHDPVAPEIVLKGSADISLAEGEAYSEPGYTATDNLDGDITDKVTVSGTVDTETPGAYTLEYAVTDSYNNSVSIRRVIRVYAVLPDPDLKMPDLPLGDGAATVVPPGKVVYLTFDDGPGPHTAKLLDILDKYNVKATFFVVKSGYMHLLSRMAASGHAVAIHCYTHKYNKVYASDEAYFNDLYQLQTLIESYTGTAPTLVRFPGGSSNTVSRKYCPGIMSRITQKFDELGYKYFDWNVDSHDASSARSTADVIDYVIDGIMKRDCSIVLQHDIKGYSVDAVEQIILWGLANGYTFMPLDSTSPTFHQKVAN